MSNEAFEKARLGTHWVTLLKRCLILSVLVALTLAAIRLLPSSHALEAEPLCRVDLPLLVEGDVSELLARAQLLLDDTENSPLGSFEASGIPTNEAKAINKVAPKDESMVCGAATYGTYPLRLLSAAWAGIRQDDVIVDFGAGNGYVLAAVALLTNATGRGIELSPTRAHRTCEVLEALRRTLGANASSTSFRKFELWQADLFAPPAQLIASPKDTSREFIAFSFANCFSDDFIFKIMKIAADLPHSHIRIMISKQLKNQTKLVELGLKRIPNPGIPTFAKT